jgi:hypothetical protein
MLTTHKLNTSLLISDLFFFWCLMSSVVVPPWSRFWSNRKEITSFNSRVIEFLAVTVLWRFVAVWAKRFCLRCLGIDVTLYAMHCFFSRIRCYGNVLQQFAVQQRRPLPPQQMGRLQLSGVMSQYHNKLFSCVIFFSICYLYDWYYQFKRKCNLCQRIDIFMKMVARCTSALYK